MHDSLITLRQAWDDKHSDNNKDFCQAELAEAYYHTVEYTTLILLNN
jgi:hypothetical protein